MVGVRGTLGVALATAALLLAWALLATPAFADAKAHGGTLQYVDCDRVQSVAGIQYNAGNSGDVHQDLNITQKQTCPSSGNAKNTDTKDDGVLADTIVKGTLPDTGGLPLPALGAYALLATGVFSLVRLIGRRR
jgi:hypothetical protein